MRRRPNRNLSPSPSLIHSHGCVRLSPGRSTQRASSPNRRFCVWSILRCLKHHLSSESGLACCTRSLQLTACSFVLATALVCTSVVVSLSDYGFLRGSIVSLIPYPAATKSTPKSRSAPLPISAVEFAREHAERLERALSAGHRQPAKRFVRWLHVPKTGTSFINTLLRWGCSDIPHDAFVVPRSEKPADLRFKLEQTMTWDWLFANSSGRTWLRRHCSNRLTTFRPISKSTSYSLYVHKAVQPWEIPHTAAFFRLPLQRIYSNYLHLSSHYNESHTPDLSLATFLKRTEFHSQQSKMLLGIHYRSPQVMSLADIERAKAIVRDQLLFIGLTEEFRLSVRLFHAMFGGVPHLAQFENIRPGIGRHRTQLGRSSAFRYDEDIFRGWRDAADEMLYAAAVRRFWSDIRLYRAEIELDGLGRVKFTGENLQGVRRWPWKEMWHDMMR